MLLRTSLVMAAVAMLAMPVWAQQSDQGAPRGRQELAEQQQVLQRNNAQQGQAQQGQAQQGQAQQRGQVQGQRGEVQQGVRQGQGQGQAQGQAQADRTAGKIDHGKVAEMFILSNKAEVELGNLALEKSQNDEVRDFAQHMVKDHTAFISKLQKFADKDNTTASQDAMEQLHRKSADLELQMTKKLLSQYEGQDFDMGYLGQQMVAHTKMLACLTAAKDIGPEEFQATIAEGIKTTNEHMQHGKQLAAAIKNKEYGEGQRREAARPDLREGQRDGAIRDGGARPSVRPQDSAVPREGAPQRVAPQRNGGARNGAQGTDGAPQSARDREGVTP